MRKVPPAALNDPLRDFHKFDALQRREILDSAAALMRIALRSRLDDLKEISSFLHDDGFTVQLIVPTDRPDAYETAEYLLGYPLKDPDDFPFDGLPKLVRAALAPPRR